MQKNILIMLLGITLIASSIFGSSTEENNCEEDFIIVCATDNLIDCPESNPKCAVETFENLCTMRENEEFSFLHYGACEPSNTPTPNPLPIELTCDNKNITTKAYHLYKETKSRKNIFLEPRAEASIYSVGINKDSILLITSEGKHTRHIKIHDEGDWGIESGSIYFTPLSDFNGTSTIQYSINNNCDYLHGRSNMATAQIKIEAPSRPLPAIEGWCLFREESVANNDKVYMKKDEKLKIINVFENDNTGVGNIPFVNPSLGIISKNNVVTQRVSKTREGTWLANKNTGQILFLPDDNFTGESNITYVMNSSCTHPYMHLLPAIGIGTREYNAQVTVVAPTHTPTPTPTPVLCPKVKNLVCGEENLCLTNATGETTCLPTIPHKTTYQNTCELFKAGDVFLYEGECHRTTPTPTPAVIPTATPSPSVKPVPSETPSPTPTPKSVQKTELKVVTSATVEPTNTTKTISRDDGTASSTLSMLLTGLLTLLIGILTMRREEV